jgi:hypothetical protein
MCIFSGPVYGVTRTHIFGRLSGNGTQFIVYSMSLLSDSDVAMILPLPVGSHDERTALRFINLEDYPEFFEDLSAATKGRPASASTRSIAPTLEVHQVGAYEASFVPTLDAFDRLDARFRLPRAVWDDLPQYADYGFAVFQLRVAGHGRRRATTFHPMAFEFVTRHPDVLFFPTVHVHNGSVEPYARFRHDLYLQDARTEPRSRGGRMVSFGGYPQLVTVSTRPAGQFMSVEDTKGVVDAEQPCFNLALGGEFKNADVFFRVRDERLEVCQ